MNKKTTISIEMYESLIFHEIPYEGHVEGYGYVLSEVTVTGRKVGRETVVKVSTISVFDISEHKAVTEIITRPPYLPGEYEYDSMQDKWTYLSSKGEEIGIGFYHTSIKNKEGKPISIIIDSQGNWNTILDGKYVLSGTIRDNDTDWNDLFIEWKKGYSPERSYFEGAHPANLEIKKHYLYKQTEKSFLNSQRVKDGLEAKWNFWDVFYDSYIAHGVDIYTNKLMAGAMIVPRPNMQAQMMGTYNISFYWLGDKILKVAQDSKSRESFYYHLPVKNYRRGCVIEFSDKSGWIVRDEETNTYQTYIFF